MAAGDWQSAFACYGMAAQQLEKEKQYGPAGQFYAKMALFDNKFLNKAIDMYEIAAKNSQHKEHQEAWLHEIETLKELAEKRKSKKGKYEQMEMRLGSGEEGKKVERQREGGLAHKITAAIALAGLIPGLFFIVPSITGNIISTAAYDGSVFIGTILFIIGIIACFFYFDVHKLKPHY